LILSSPEYLNISSSLLSINLIKKTWVAIKKINGNISNIIEGVFKKDKNTGNKKCTFILLKNSD
tara:strand:- start:22 stop:213 length:192 start_codon:yes stop_codon:yes gene_type:complete